MIRGLALGMLLATSILSACGQSSTVAVVPPHQTEAPLPSSGERTYRVVPLESTASYQAQEKWLSWPAPTKAIAKTGDVDGELTLIMGDQPRLSANRFRVDLRTLVSEAADTPVLSRPAGVFLAQRDQVVRNLLETGAHPFAEFTATGVDGLPDRYVEGQSVKVRVPGNLTIHGMTRPVLLDTEATLQGETLSGTATVQIRMTDFGVQPPANNGAMDVEDHLSLVVRFLAKASITTPEVSPDDRHPKLDTPLAMLVRVALDRGTDEALNVASEMNLELVDGSVRVVVSHNRQQAQSARALVAAAGGKVEAEALSATGALVPISAIRELADSPIISAIRIPLRED